jgi:hypothetical protein
MDKDAFFAWLKSSYFVFNQGIDICSSNRVHKSTDADGNKHLTPMVDAVGWIVCDGNLPDGTPVNFSYDCRIAWFGTTTERFKDGYLEGLSSIRWGTKQLIVTDKEGIPLDSWNIDDLIIRKLPKLSEFSWNHLLPNVKERVQNESH